MTSGDDIRASWRGLRASTTWRRSNLVAEGPHGQSRPADWAADKAGAARQEALLAGVDPAAGAGTLDARHAVRPGVLSAARPRCGSGRRRSRALLDLWTTLTDSATRRTPSPSWPGRTPGAPVDSRNGQDRSLSSNGPPARATGWEAGNHRPVFGGERSVPVYAR